jgi:hypothetical protein
MFDIEESFSSSRDGARGRSNAAAAFARETGE